MNIKTKFDMKDILKDSISGFEGVVVAITKFATGCVHYGLALRNLKADGTLYEWQWLDESTLECVNKDVKNAVK